MKETTSLITGKDTSAQEEATTNTPALSWRLQATAVALLGLFAACILFSTETGTAVSPRVSSAHPFLEGGRQEESPSATTFVHTLEQRLELWDHWKDLPDDLSLAEDRVYTHTKHKHKKHKHKHDDIDTSLVYMNHSEAFYLLLGHHGDGGPFSYSSDYFLLNQGLDAQINQAYCAVATSMAVLNSLRGLIDEPQDPIYDPYPYATQTDAFNDCTQTNVIVHNETFHGILSAPGGMSLDSAEKLLRCHLPEDQWLVQSTHVDASVTSSDMRGALKDALANPNARVLINYHRAIAGQVGGGHFSPLGAYSPVLDAFLIMDVAKYKYPPVWINTETLYQALFAMDTCGKWNGPAAQAALSPELLHPESVTDLAAAMVLLGCEPASRGYIVVSKK